MYELVHSRHSVGLSNYHLQFTPKYRRDVFTKARVRKTCRTAFAEAATKMDIDILALEFGPDHVHIFVGNCKNYSVPDMAQRFKGYSSYVIRQEHRDSIKDKLWGNHFWSSGYFYEAVGRITSETAQFYIERQQKKHWMNIDHGPYDVTVSAGQTTLTDFQPSHQGTPRASARGS